MKKWILVASLVLLGALAFAACGGDDDGDSNTELADDGNLPQVSDDARVPGVGEYRVTVSFNEDVLAADLDEIGALLAGYDADADYIIQESFPPTGVATLIADAEDFCETVVSSLEAEAFVTAASCGPQLEPGGVDGDDVVPGELTDSDCEPVELRSDCGIDTDECNQVHNIDACTGENDLPGDGVTSAVCAPGFPDCEDTIVTMCDGDACTGDNDADVGAPPSVDALPPAPDDAVPGPAEFRLTIRFNETVVQDQLDEVGARIRDFDPDAEYVIQESFPPTGVANFAADTEDVCLALTQDLEDETFVTSASCGPQLEPGDLDPDEPVVNDLE